MLEEKMIININGLGKEFAFNFDRKVMGKPYLHQALLDSINKNFKLYGNIMGINECILLRDLDFNIEYIINNRVHFNMYWEFECIIFHIIKVGEINELSFDGDIYFYNEPIR